MAQGPPSPRRDRWGLLVQARASRKILVTIAVVTMLLIGLVALVTTVANHDRPPPDRRGSPTESYRPADGLAWQP